MTATSTPPSSVPLSDPRARVRLLTALVALLAVVVAALTPGFFDAETFHPLAALALALAFTVSERLVFHVEARNEAISYTPTDIALAIGILFVNPLELVAARILGAAAGSALWRRSPLFKLLFNLAHFALETVLAVALFRALFDDPAATPLTWFGLLGALMVALIVGGLLVAVAISSFEGGLAKRLIGEVINAPVFYLPVAVVAASVAIPMLIEPWLGVIALSSAPVVWFVVRSHGALLHRYTDLTSVHEFSRQVGNDADPHDIAGTAVVQIADNLRANGVALRVWDAAGSHSDATHGATIPIRLLPDRPDDPAWDAAFSSRQPVRAVADPFAAPGTLSRHLAEAGMGEAVVAPLADDRGRLGALAVWDRQGVSSAFDDDDRNRLGGLAQQLTVALRKGQFNAQIQYEATHDRLTNLPNRGFFEASIDRVIAGSNTAAVLLLDLDRFKEINDAFGHHAGDQLLMAVADRIRDHVDDTHIAARFGGDEFAILAPGATAAEALEIAETLSIELEQPFDLGPATVAIASSIGVAAAPEHGLDGATLMRRADIAMYDAKKRHVRSSAYADSLEENDSVRLALLADLRSTLAQNALDVYFQPKVDLRTGDVIGAEALARWTHPERGPISPDVFVSLAEQSGLIETLTRVVLAKSLAAVAEWQRRNWELGVAVNVSAQSLLDEQLADLVSDELERTGVDPALLTLEITESTMMGDPARSHRILRGLSDLGVRLSVDDYGTGFSSLVNLRHLPVSELKIDRSFVSELMADSSDEVIVRSTIDLGHNLGLRVVAEGVEDDDIQRRLADLGCDIAQGFGISRPLPLDAFGPWLLQYREAVAARAHADADRDRLTVPVDELSPG